MVKIEIHYTKTDIEIVLAQWYKWISESSIMICDERGDSIIVCVNDKRKIVIKDGKG